MDRKMYEVGIKVTGQSIFLSQADPAGDETRIILTYDQAQIVSEWLLEARRNIDSGESLTPSISDGRYHGE